MLPSTSQIDQMLGIGQGNFSSTPVHLAPSYAWGNGSLPSFTHPEPTSMSAVPIAYAVEDIRTLERIEFGLGRFAPALLPASHQQGTVRSLEYLLRPEKVEPQVVVCGQEEVDALTQVIEGNLPRSQVLPYKPILEGSLAQRIFSIEHDPRFDKDYSLRCYTALTKYPPYEVLKPPCLSDTENHPWQWVVALANDLEDEEIINLQLLVTPCPSEFNNILCILRDRVEFLANPKYDVYRNRADPRINDEVKGMTPGKLFFCSLRMVAILKKTKSVALGNRLHEALEAFSYGLSEFKVVSKETYLSAGNSLQPLYQSLVKRQANYEGFVLTEEEMGLLFPLPNLHMLLGTNTPMPVVMSERISRLPPPKDSFLLGLNPPDDRCLWVDQKETVPGIFFVGAPGVGKTTGMLDLLRQHSSLEHGMFICLPHSSLHQILGAIGKEQYERCVIIDSMPPDGKPVGLNLFEGNDEIVISEFVNIVKRFAESTSSSPFGSQMEELLWYTIKLVAGHGGTIAHVHEAVANEKYRGQLMEGVSERNLKTYFTQTLPDRRRFGRESNTSVTNRLSFLLESRTRNLFCQPTSTVSIRELIENDRIIILDLKEGRLGSLISSVLAGPLLLLINAEVMRRSVERGAQRPFANFTDECSWYYTEGITDILSRGRVFGCRTIAGAQYLNQFSNNIFAALMSCLPVKIAYRISGKDAQLMQREMNVSEHALVQTPNYHAYCRLGENTYYIKGHPPLAQASDDDVMRVREQTSSEFGGTPVSLDDDHYFNQILPKRQRQVPKKTSRKLPFTQRSEK
jgi:hypothetical protein